MTTGKKLLFGPLALSGALALLVGLSTTETQFAWAGVLFLGLAGFLAVTERQAARRRAEFTALFGTELAEKMVQGVLWMGETHEQVRASLGPPADTDQEVLKTKTKETWKHQPMGNNRFGLCVRFENGAVVGWEKK